MRTWVCMLGLFVVSAGAASCQVAAEAQVESTLNLQQATESCRYGMQKLCDKYKTCQPTWFEVMFRTVDECIQVWGDLCAQDFLLPGTAVTVEKVEACADAQVAMACGPFLMADGWAGCKFVGALENGVKCLLGSQCKSAACSRVPGSVGTCGVCYTPVKKDGDCTKDGCEAGSVCDGSKCIAPAAEGDACDSKHPCQEWSTCSAQSVCVASGDVGQPCEDELNGTCKSGDYICAPYNGGSRQCRNMTLGNEGDPCGTTVGENITYCRLGNCNTTTHTCVQNIELGSPCAPSGSWAVCRWPGGCFDGTCRLFQASDFDTSNYCGK